MSEQTQQRNYIKGSARMFKFQNGGEVLNLSLKLEDMAAIANERGYVNMTVAVRRETDDYGNTHLVYENTFKPEQGKQGQKPQGNKAPAAKDDLPF